MNNQQHSPLLQLRLFFLIGLLWSVSSTQTVHAEDWPRWLGPRGDSTWRDEGIVRRLPESGSLPIRWRAPIGAGYSGPVVVRGRVFIMDRPSTKQVGADNKALDRTSESGKERVLCLDASSGRMIWSYDYDCPYNIAYAAGPRAMPTVEGNRVYTLGAEGDLHCFDFDTGRVIWRRNFKSEYGVSTQLWGFSASPVVVGDSVICLVGGIGQTAVAFDREKGVERWRALNAKEPGYSTPALYVPNSGPKQLIVWDPEHVSGLDPATGRVHWSIPFRTKMGHSVITPRIDGNRIFVSAFFDGSLLIDIDPADRTAREVWRIKGSHETKTQALHSLMSPAFSEGGHLYGICSYGHLRCLEIENGNRRWETLAVTTHNGKPARWASAFMVKHEDRFFILNEHGELILARMNPEGYQEDSRVRLIEPTNKAGPRKVLWSHPAYSEGHIYARNDAEILCADLRAHRTVGGPKN